MKALSATVLAAIASSSVALVQLVKIEFASGTVALNTSNWDLDWLGTTYKGAYGLGSISQIEDKPGEVQGITLSIDGGASANIALALDAADEVQGAAVTIRSALVSTSTYAVLDAPVDWVGTCDTMAISEDGASAVVSVSVESNAVDLLRGTPSTYSDADQQAAYAGDLAFAYVVDQVDKPVVWPSREYFFQ
jgi:hypothetical protein